MRKRILNILLAMIMVFTMIPSVTKADESENVYISVSYDIEVVKGISYSAVCLYTGDDVDLIPSTQKAVAVSVVGIENARIVLNVHFLTRHKIISI